MILISHRGNIDGKNSEKENTVAYITEALDKGYHCEIDVCKFDGKQFYLGHDEPQESVSMSWLDPGFENAHLFEQLFPGAGRHYKIPQTCQES